MTDLARSSAPWSVKGVNRGARDAAREAAQAAGLTIGQWIDRAILRHAGLAEMPGPAPAIHAAARPSQKHAEVQGHDNAGEPVEPDPQLIELSRQVEAAERHMSEQLLPVGKAVEALAKRLVDIEAKRREGEEARQPDEEGFPGNGTEAHTASGPAEFAGLVSRGDRVYDQSDPIGRGAEASSETARQPVARRSLLEREPEPVEPVQPPSEIIDFESRLKLGSETRIYRRTKIAPEQDDEAPPPRRWRRRLLMSLAVIVMLCGIVPVVWFGYQATQKPGIEWADVPDQMVVEAEQFWVETLGPGFMVLRTEVAAFPWPDLGELFKLPTDWQLPTWLADFLGLTSETPASPTAPSATLAPATGPSPPPSSVPPPATSNTAPQMPPPVASTAAPPAAPMTAPSTTPPPQAAAPPPRPAAPAPQAASPGAAAPSSAGATQQAALPPPSTAARSAPAAPDVTRRPPAAPAAPAADADPAARLAWLENMAKQGDAKAQHDLAILYAKGEGAAQDFSKAAYWFREAAVQNIPIAQYNLGVLYETGLGVTKDEVRALLWYHTAAELNHPNAQYNFGIYFLDGRGGIAKNTKEAVRWLRRAADQGVARALFVLGKIYEEGREDIEPNMQEAVKFYMRAADRGYAEARTELARLGRATSSETPAAQRAGRAQDPNAVPTAPAPVAAGAPASSLRPGAATPAAASAPTPNAARDTVMAIQQLLQQLNLNPGPADGFIGPRTTNAIKRYQETNGLAADGLPSEALLRHLSEHARTSRVSTN